MRTPVSTIERNGRRCDAAQGVCRRSYARSPNWAEVLPRSFVGGKLALLDALLYPALELVEHFGLLAQEGYSATR